jgi:hypothetical protein
MLHGYWWWRLIRLEDVQALELLIKGHKRLKLLRFGKLSTEPILDFVLLDFLEVAVHVVKMSA